MDHDQNFKNLIVDYPKQSLEFFAPEEAYSLNSSVKITPVRQEQLKARLGDRFRELDAPLLVEWPDGRREALLFAVEEHTDPRSFSIHRIAQYCLDLAEMFGTHRVVPVVIFLKPHDCPHELLLGGDKHVYLEFHYLASHLKRLSAEDYRYSDNLVARLNLPNMAWKPEQKIDVYAWAIRGLMELEPSIEKQLKYVDFIDIYTQLDDNEKQQYQQRYPEEFTVMTGFAERYREEGIQQGEATLLHRLINKRFGELPEWVEQKLTDATSEQLEAWGVRIFDASSLKDLFE